MSISLGMSPKYRSAPDSDFRNLEPFAVAQDVEYQFAPGNQRDPAESRDMRLSYRRQLVANVRDQIRVFNARTRSVLAVNQEFVIVGGPPLTTGETLRLVANERHDQRGVRNQWGITRPPGCQVI